MNKNEILNKLKELKPIYQNEGLEILGVFGSYAKETNTKYSDIDIAYKLDYDKFSKKYIGGFSKILRIIEDIDFIINDSDLKITQAINDKIIKPAIKMNIIRIAEQFSKLKDDNIIEEVIRYNLPIFKQTILDIKKEF